MEESIGASVMPEQAPLRRGWKRLLVSRVTNIYALDGVNTKMLKSVTVQTEKASEPMA